MAMKPDPTTGLFNGNPYVLSNGTSSPGYFNTTTNTSKPVTKREWTGSASFESTDPTASIFGTSGSIYTAGSGTPAYAVPSGSYFVSPAFVPDEEYDTTPIIEALVRDLIHRKYPRAKLK